MSVIKRPGRLAGSRTNAPPGNVTQPPGGSPPLVGEVMGRRHARAAGLTAVGPVDASGVCPTWLLPAPVLHPVTITRARLQRIDPAFITRLLVKRPPDGSVTTRLVGPVGVEPTTSRL